jgi:hypothetical protein
MRRFLCALGVRSIISLVAPEPYGKTRIQRREETAASGDFWSNVRSAVNFITPQVIADVPRLDADTIEQGLRRTTHWLGSPAVAGFNETGFDFLANDERGTLAQLVTAFRRIASEVRSTGSATDDQVAQALPLFRDIVAMLEFDRYGDAEAYRLGKQIELAIEPDRPGEPAELRFNTGPDHSGDPAIWIWTFLTDAAAESDERFLENAGHLRDMLDPVARAIAPDRWPYFSFRLIAEQAETVEAS